MYSGPDLGMLLSMDMMIRYCHIYVLAAAQAFTHTNPDTELYRHRPRAEGISEGGGSTKTFALRRASELELEFTPPWMLSHPLFVQVPVLAGLLFFPSTFFLKRVYMF